MQGGSIDIGRATLALRMLLVALGVGFGVHLALWFWFAGPAVAVRPDVLWPMLGPALLPTTVVALCIAVSDRFDDWFWIFALSLLVFALEQVVFWTWRATIDQSLGFEFLYMMPILGGFPLALISYAAADGWR